MTSRLAWLDSFGIEFGERGRHIEPDPMAGRNRCDRITVGFAEKPNLAGCKRRIAHAALLGFKVRRCDAKTT